MKYNATTQIRIHPKSCSFKEQPIFMCSCDIEPISDFHLDYMRAFVEFDLRRDEAASTAFLLSLNPDIED
jgi:hypothetical protein